MAEMRLITQGYGIEGEVKDVYFQIIPADEVLADLNFSSKMNTSWEFLNDLRQLGRNTATDWLKSDLQFVGKKSSPVIKDLFGFVEENWLHEMMIKPARHLKANPIPKKSDISENVH
jgi:hypothetical protein